MLLWGILTISLFHAGKAQIDLITMFSALPEPSAQMVGVHPDADKSTTELIQSKGYPAEEHFVTTRDGYILGIQRIPNGRSEDAGSGPKRVVLLHHGLLSTSADFVLNYANNSLGFILADEGYDVWLTNARGNRYSKNHTSISPLTGKFWEFSFDQIAAYDLTAAIDYILEQTKVESIYYGGHSLGTTVMFALLSSQPSYQKKIKVFSAMAPVTVVKHNKSPIGKFYRTTFLLTQITGVISTRGKLDYDAPFMKTYLKMVCGNFLARNTICKPMLFFLDGIGTKHLDESRMVVYLTHFPSTASVNTLLQLVQSISSNKFQKFNYGYIGNMREYGTVQPPQYDLSLIQTPVGLISSPADVFAQPKDVQFARERLANVVQDIVIDTPGFMHADFPYGFDADKYVYRHVIDLFKKYD